MTINLKAPDIRELRPRITVFGVGGAGGNAVNNMISAGLHGVEFVVANTDAQALALSKAQRVVQMGVQVTQGLGAGSQPEVGRAAAEEVIDEIRDHLLGSHMVFVTAGMGGGTGTGAAPVVARAAREAGILTVAVVTKPFQFEGQRRMKIAEAGIAELQKYVDTQLIIPNQNLFRIANEKTTFADAFAMADQVLYSGVACITDLMVKEGLINLDFADVRAVMREMGKAMMGTGESSGDKRALRAAEGAISNPLIDDVSMKGARGLLISITGGSDLTLYEVDEAATRIREEVDPEANIIVGATFDESLDGIIRVSVVATGIDQALVQAGGDNRFSELSHKLRAVQRTLEVPEKTEAAMRPATQATQIVQNQAAQQIAPRQEPVAREPIEPAALAPRTPMPKATSIEDVTLRPMPARPPLFRGPVEDQAPRFSDTAPQKAFIPPTPERVMRPTRMPRMEDLPPQAQREIKASRGEDLDTAQPEKRSSSLLQRLASVGLGRRDDEPNHDDKPANQLQNQAGIERSATPPQARPRDPVSDYAKRQPPARPHPQGLDPHGRPNGQPSQIDDDHLDIPAFLRRQSQ